MLLVIFLYGCAPFILHYSLRSAKMGFKFYNKSRFLPVRNKPWKPEPASRADARCFVRDAVEGCSKKAVSHDCASKIAKGVWAANVKNTFFWLTRLLLFCTVGPIVRTAAWKLVCRSNFFKGPWLWFHRALVYNDPDVDRLLLVWITALNSNTPLIQ